MNSRYLSLALVVALAYSFPAAGQNTASIQGTIVDSGTGKVVAGAVVIATSSSAPAARQTATSAFDGSFQIPSLATGTYNLCVQVPGDGYLATCNWGTPATTLTLVAGQKSTGNKLSIKAGSVLKVHIGDPGQLLNQKTKDGYAPHLVMGIWCAGMFYAAHGADKSATSADYQVTVPFDTPLSFSIQSRDLVIGDAVGVPLANNGGQQSLNRSSSEANPAGFSYTILSAKP